jgi:hypothetical protein
MPSDNLNPIAGGSPIEFPLPLASPSPSIIRVSSSTFNLLPGTYYIGYHATVQGSGQGILGGQLVVSLGGTELGNTIVGTDIDFTEISGMTIVTVAVTTSLRIINPAGNGSLILTPNAGDSGTSNAVSAHLVILRIQ